MWKLKEEFKCLVQGYTIFKWPSQVENPGPLAPKTILLNICYHLLSYLAVTALTYFLPYLPISLIDIFLVSNTMHGWCSLTI